MRQCNTTLYPGLEINVPGPDKRSKNVELTKLNAINHEEEIDSPTFSPGPPFPPSMPPPAGRKPSTDAMAPELPKRPARRSAPPVPPLGARLTSQETQQQDRPRGDSKDSAGSSKGVDNSAFVGDSIQEVKVSSQTPKTPLHYDDDDENTYEEYLENKRQSIKRNKSAGDNGIELEDSDAYEEPVDKKTESTTEEFIKRQSSISGLPDFPTAQSGAGLQQSDQPLHVRPGFPN